MAVGKIRVGVGGWSFGPWRGVFYPDGLRQKDGMAYAVSQMTAIEINGTYYSTQSRKSFASGTAAAPAGSEFSAKALRYCANRKMLVRAGLSTGKYMRQGLDEPGDKLGPIVRQFAATKTFDAQDFAAFLDLLPEKLEGRKLRHALDVRNASFDDPAFVEMARYRGMAIVHTDHPECPLIEADTADFVYARVMKAQDNLKKRYSLDKWVDKARDWA